MRGWLLGAGHLRALVRVRSGRGGPTCEPGTVRSFRKPSIWHVRALIPVCGSTDRRDRSEPLVGTSRCSDIVRDIDPQAGVVR